MAEFDDLIQQFGSGSGTSPAPDTHQFNDLIQEFGSGEQKPQTRKERLKAEAPQRMKELKAFGQGLLDVVNAGSGIIGYIDEKVGPGGTERNKANQERINKENETFKTDNPPSEGWLPTVPEVARTAGQIASTAPLTPMRAFQAVRGGLGALPTIASTGEKIAAPFINRLAASTVTGAGSGAEFGALTSQSNDKSLAQNTGEGLILGALTAPVLSVAAEGAKKVLPTVKNMWANVQINKIAEQAKMEPSAVKNTLEVIQDAGYTPQQAQAALNKLGPQATLSDLAQSVQSEASGIASFGGKPTEILKGRYEARAKTANSQAHDVMEQKLGPKPNFEEEKQSIIDQARKETSADYKAAKASGSALDLQSTVDNINQQLESAVGGKEAALKQLKGFLFKTGKDASGNDIQVLKHGVKDLHEIRQAIDDVLDKRGTPETSYGKNAINAIKEVRNNIDTQLKTVPEMAAADAKFTEKMQLKNHLETGYEALKNNGMNIEEFSKYYDSLTTDQKTKVASGMRAHIGDLMEKASRGELSEAQRLFGKNSRNRANLEKVFGNNGSETLDALEKEATFIRTEQKVMHGAQTAERQSIQRKYGERNDKGGEGLKDIVSGMVLDTVTGTPGAATGIMAVKRFGSSVRLNAATNRREAMVEGTADLLSRSGAERDTGLGVAARVKAIQDKIKPKLNISLPSKAATYLFSAPAGQLTYEQYKNSNQ